MLPAALVFNMEGCSNNLNNNASDGYFPLDDSVILNGVRNRKKNSELPNCPVCSCTIRSGELETHMSLEVERLVKLSCGSKRKLSQTGGSNLAVPGPSMDNLDLEETVPAGTGSQVFQRVHSNRLSRLRSRSRRSPSPKLGQCPVCDAQLPVYRLQRHALRCLKRTGAEVDEDIPDSSDEDIDVENDDESQRGFGAEYQWCGEWRVRASALDGGAREGTSVRRVSQDTALVVDGDEDTELYGPAQYSPSRIDPENTISIGENSIVGEQRADTENNTDNNISTEKKCNGLVEASAETRIQALKEKIKDLESRQNSEAKCLICLAPHISPAVSIQCWHVYCEVCWLESLRAKKICPQCNAITTTQHLRRIYM